MILLSLFDYYYKLYCLDFSENSYRQWPETKTESINLLSSITACTHIIGDGYTHPYSVKYPFEANFYSCPNKHLGWNCGVSNVGHNSHSFGPFGLVFRTKLALILLPRFIKRWSLLIFFQSYSNMIGLLIPVLRQPIGDLLVIVSM